jgi:hypothetical protein
MGSPTLIRPLGFDLPEGTSAPTWGRRIHHVS